MTLYQRFYIVFSIFFISLFSTNVQAQLQIIPESNYNPMNCSAERAVCLDTYYSIKDYIYLESYPVCDNASCNTYKNYIVYGKSRYEVLNYYSQKVIEYSQTKSPTRYTSGYQDCYSDTVEGIFCYSTITTRVTDSQGNVSWIQSRGGNFGITKLRGPRNCPNGDRYYLPGLGCALPESSTNTSNLTVPGIENSCRSGLCPNSELGRIPQEITTPTVGNPIDLMTGSKIESVVDTSFPITFSRNYVSKRNTIGVFGRGWKHNFEKKLTPTLSYNGGGLPFVASVIIKEENDEEIIFARQDAASSFTPFLSSQTSFSLTQTSGSFYLKTPNGQTEVYDNNGFLSQIIQKNGYTLNFSFSAAQLTQITDSYGRSLSLEYSTDNLIKKITSSSSFVLTYTYDNFNLVSQSLNGTHTINYGYNTNNLLNYKSNAKNQPYGAYDYDTSGNAILSQNYLDTEFIHINNITYTGNTSVMVSQPNGSTQTYNKTKASYRYIPSSSIYNDGTQNITTSNLGVTSNGLIGYYTDISGNTFGYIYDTDGFLASTTKNNTAAKKTIYTWDKVNNLLLTETQPSNATNGVKTTTYSYDSDDNVLNKTVATTNSGTRVWNYTWGTYGRLLTKTDPSGATTTYSYYPDNATNPNQRGLLYQIINALGQTITVNQYDSLGNPISITNIDGQTKTFTYNDLGQILSETVAGMNNQYIYDLDGLLTQFTLSNGYSVNLTYDQLGRLTNLSDNVGGSIAYTLDNTTDMPTNVSMYSNTQLFLTSNRVFDSLARLKEIWGNDSNEKYTYSYTTASKFRPATINNPKSQNLSLTYNREYLTGQNGLGKTYSSNFDNYDNTANITFGGSTYYATYNEFSDIITSFNLVSGSNTYSYDVTNRQKTIVDAANISQTATYDALGRATAIVAGSETKNMTYDTNYVGQLSTANNNDVNITYNYNAAGLLTQKTQTIGALSSTKALNYTYSSYQELSSITYPSGLVVNYNYDKGRISEIQINNQNLISNITYQPFTNTILEWSWANGLTRQVSYDTSGKITSLSDGPVSQSYTLDGLFGITQIVDSGITKNYEYNNAANSLTKYISPNKTQTYAYDTSRFLRTSLTDTRPSLTNAYTNGGYKLTSWKTTPTGQSQTVYAQTYDLKGNITNNGKSTFTYNNFNRMTSATTNGTTTNYIYDTFSQRVAKTNSTSQIIYLYSESGQLVGEYNGTDSTEYVYFGTIPVAVVKNGVIYYIHTDHLNTPRKITDANQNTVWQWENNDPFGNYPAQNLGIEFNFRFPGQYFDNETNLFYNYFRYYNPETGKYMQPDPISLQGGLDLYAYVENNPLGGVDPFGLDEMRLFKPVDYDDQAVMWGSVNALGTKNILRVMSHGSHNGMAGAQTAEVIANLIKQTDYYKRRKNEGKPLIIFFDVCDAAFGDNPIVQQISKYLDQNNIVLGATQDVVSGLGLTFPFSRELGSSSLEKYDLFDKRQVTEFSFGTWGKFRQFENGKETSQYLDYTQFYSRYGFH